MNVLEILMGWAGVTLVSWLLYMLINPRTDQNKMIAFSLFWPITWPVYLVMSLCYLTVLPFTMMNQRRHVQRLIDKSRAKQLELRRKEESDNLMHEHLVQARQEHKAIRRFK